MANETNTDSGVFGGLVYLAMLSVLGLWGAQHISSTRPYLALKRCLQRGTNAANEENS